MLSSTDDTTPRQVPKLSALLAAEVRRFAADVIEVAGGAEIVSAELAAIGVDIKAGSVRSWTYRQNANIPGGDVLMALSWRWGVSLDRYVSGEALAEELEGIKARYEALVASSADGVRDGEA